MPKHETAGFYCQVSAIAVGIIALQRQCHMVSVCAAKLSEAKRMSGLLRPALIPRFCLYSDDIIYHTAEFMTHFFYSEENLVFFNIRTCRL